MDERDDLDEMLEEELRLEEEARLEAQVEAQPDDEGNIYAEQRRLYEAGEVDSPYFEDDCGAGEEYPDDEETRVLGEPDDFDNAPPAGYVYDEEGA